MSDQTAVTRSETIARALRRITTHAGTVQQTARRLEASFTAKVERATSEYLNSMQQLLQIVQSEQSAPPASGNGHTAETAATPTEPVV